jgi:hypothetical protein
VKKFLLVALLLALTVPAGAQFYTVRYSQLTVGAAAVAITTATLRPNPPGQPQASACHFQLQGAEIRYTFDGSTTPTAAVGTIMAVGANMTFNYLPDLMALRFIRTTGTDGVLNIHCWTAAQ